MDSNIKIEGLTVKAKDGSDISALAVGFDDSRTRAVIIISHGFGEHAAMYTELAEQLYQSGYACIIPNQRGHGIPPSGVKKWHGRITGYQGFIDDIMALTAYIADKRPDTPVALYGHSMGGNIVINTLLSANPEEAAVFKCAVLESPWLSLYKQPNKLAVAALNILCKIMPDMIIAHKLNYNDLTSIDSKATDYGKDPYYHGFLSLRLITGMFKACNYITLHASKLPIPVFLAQADGDVVVCNKAIDTFAQAAQPKVTFKKYESKHAIHNDAVRDTYINDIISFYNENI